MISEKQDTNTLQSMKRIRNMKEKSVSRKTGLIDEKSPEERTHSFEELIAYNITACNPAKEITTVISGELLRKK